MIMFESLVTPPMGVTKPQRKRGGCLSAYLVLLVLGSLLMLLGGNAVAILTLLCTYGIWKWKKWGVFTLVSIDIASFVYLILFGPFLPVTVLIYLCDFGILYFLMSRRWQYFS